MIYSCEEKGGGVKMSHLLSWYNILCQLTLIFCDIRYSKNFFWMFSKLSEKGFFFSLEFQRWLCRTREDKIFNVSHLERFGQ